MDSTPNYRGDGRYLRSDASTPTPYQRQVTPLRQPYQNFSRPLAPRTPQPIDTTPTQQPPNAPREQVPKFRIRRRRMGGIMDGSIDLQHLQQPTIDVPIPSIELSTHIQQIYHDSESRPLTPIDRDLLSPAVPERRFFSPPRTPVSQINTSFDAPRDYDDECVTPKIDFQHLERPSSAMSIFSDSSCSSISSSDTSPSFGGSCTSPESEFGDPFCFPDVADKSASLASPLKFHSTSKPRKRRSAHHVKWTPEMDEHLWMTYLAYQTNPEVTPFKALPGVAPPLGVCHRVARDAKRKWRGPRGALNSIAEDPSQSFESIDTVMRENSAPPQLSSPSNRPLTPRPLAPSRPRSSHAYTRKPSGQWPRSEASTRKRLRELCKSKPNLPAHYQRLMQTRSPSPFASSSSSVRQSSRHFSPSPTSKADDDTTFATDDLKMSLKTQTMTSMQPGNPLYQLASEPPAASPQHHYNTWSASSSRNAHQKSQSLPYGARSHAFATNPRSRAPLASPFLEDPFTEHPPSSSQKAKHVSAPRAPISQSFDAADKSHEPWQIHAPRPMSGSMKRRAEYDLGKEPLSSDSDPKPDFLQDLFPAHVPTTTEGHKRMRSRGFSLGATRHRRYESQQQSTKQLAELFTAPRIEEQAESVPPELDIGSSSVGNMVGLGRLAPPALPRQPRLGSPFAPAAGMSNTFPRSLFPHGLDSISNLDQHRQQPPPRPLAVYGLDGSSDVMEQGESDPFMNHRG